MKERAKLGKRHSSDSAWWPGTLPLVALILLMPIVVDPLSRDMFRQPKLLLAQILGLASVLGCLWILGRDRGRIPPATWMRHPLVGFCAVLLILAAISSLAAPPPRDLAIQLIIHLAIGCACWLAWALVVDRRVLRRLLDLWMLPAVFLAVIGILQYHQIWEPFEFAQGARMARVRITSLAGASGDLAAFLVLPLLIGQLRLLQEKRRALFILVFLLLAYGLGVTQNMTAIATALLSSCLLWSLLLSGKRFTLRFGGALLVLAVVVFSIAPLRSRAARVGEFAANADLNGLLSGRLDAWKVASFMWRESPWIGLGPGAYRGEFARVKLEMAQTGAEFYQRHVFANFSTAHNEFLQVLAELGLLGGIAISVCVFFLARRLWTLPVSTAEERESRALGWSGFAALFLLSMAYFPFRIALTAYLFLHFTAWVFSAEGEGREVKG